MIIIGTENWLRIYLKVDSRLGKWQTIDPSLTTWEIQEIINWLEQLSINIEPEGRLITFTEPSLSLELLNNPTAKEKLVRIIFNLELRPKSAKRYKEYYVDILASNKKLTEIVKELQHELEKYPERK